MYKCMGCKKAVAKIEDKIRCPYCGYRIFAKVRPAILKKVQAR